MVPFIFSTTDTAICEFTPSLMRVWVSDALVTRASVSSAVTNGGFDSDVASWTDNDEGGGVSAWVAGGYLGLTGNGTAAAIREQEITVAVGDQSVEHALDIVIQQGNVTLRVGSTTGDDDYIGETSLGTGAHSLSLTPTGNFFIEFSSRLKRQVLVDSCDVASSGVMSLVAPYAGADMDKIRWDQSADIVYLGTDGYQQYKIERRSTTSWSLVKYEPLDGPFANINTGPITISSSALSGSATLTASANLFKSTDVGSLYRITSSGQTVTADVTAENSFTNTIKVTGVTSQRIFTIVRAGTWVATVKLQRSLTSDTGPWEDVDTYNSNGTITYDDTLDNQTAWYRIGVKTGHFTSGTVELSLDYPIGSIDGIVRVKTFTTEVSVVADIIADLGGTDATDSWYAGDWSDRVGYPTSVALVEGRLAWAGRDKVWLSVSDAYESFDDTVIGDSGTIRRTIGSGPVDNVNWLMPLRRLLMGTDSAEWSLRSSSDDEPLTPTNASPKTYSTQGSATVNVAKVDGSGVFVQRGQSRLMESSYGANFEYVTSDLTLLFPEAGNSPIARMAVQRQPDTRIHCIRDDGMAAVLIHDPAENITCWTIHETGDGAETIAADGSGGNGSWGEEIASVSVGGGDCGASDISTVSSIAGEFTLTHSDDDFSVAFSSDGTRMYAGGGASVLEVIEYTLSTAWDVTTAVENGNTLDYSPEGGAGAALVMHFKSDGTSLYLSFSGSHLAWQYNMTSAWDVSTATYASKSFDFSSEATWQAWSWGNSGTKVYMAGGVAQTFYEYDASVAWDISSLVYNSNSIAYPDTIGITALDASGDGSWLYAGESVGEQIFQYSFGTAWDITTLVSVGITLDLGALITGTDLPKDFYFSDNCLYIMILDREKVVSLLNTSVGVSDETTITYTAFDTPASGSTSAQAYSSTTATYTTMLIEDLVILPGGDGTSEDRVYYVVNRLVDGSVVRYLEKWALESECQGGTINKCSDAHLIGTITGGVMTGLTHLEGKEVCVWVNGKDLGRKTVASGQITGLSEDGSNACAGIVYTARFRSMKLGELTEHKNVARLGVILHNTHYQGLLYGPDFEGGNLDNLPLVEDGTTTADDTVHSQYDRESFSFDGRWESDSRLCLQTQSPRPCTLLAAIIEMES